MRKRKKRYRRRYRRRYSRRMSYNRTMRKAGEEVKYATVYNSGKGIPIDIDGDTILSTSAFIFNNLFAIINKGTKYFERIGNKIFVKNIVLKADMWTCGFTENSNRRDVTSALVRIMLTNLNASFSSPAFFSPDNGGSKMLAPINRKNYRVHYDKTINISAGYPNDNVLTSSSYYTGKIQRFSANIRVNKFISWNDFTSIAGAGSEGLTDHNSYYSLSAICAIPRNGADGATPVCSNWYARIYFTDA